MGFFDKLKQGLGKTKDSFNEKINDIFSNFRKVDEELLEELEEILIMSDVGMDTSLSIIDGLRNRIKKEKIEDEETDLHYTVGKTIRDAIEKLGGTMPEDLPTPDKSLKEIEEEQNIKAKQIQS